MEKDLLTLTDEKLKTIYTDESFRNAVAYAHGHADSNGKHQFYGTCTYPTKYIVTPGQIEAGKLEIEAAKKRITERMKANPQIFVFVGMGMSYPERNADDLCNHRIRAEFKNAAGHSYFLEVGTAQGDKMRVDHSIDRDLENETDRKREELFKKRDQYPRGSKMWYAANEEAQEYWKQPYNNFAGLEHGMYYPYTKANLLKMINEKFGCFFTSIEVDNYTLSTEDFINVSPRKTVSI